VRKVKQIELGKKEEISRLSEKLKYIEGEK